MRTTTRILTAAAVTATALGLGVGGASAETYAPPLSVTAVPSSDNVSILVTVRLPAGASGGNFNCITRAINTATGNATVFQTVTITSSTDDFGTATIPAVLQAPPGPSYTVEYDCTAQYSVNDLNGERSQIGSLPVSFAKPTPKPGGLFNFGSS